MRKLATLCLPLLALGCAHSERSAAPGHTEIGELPLSLVKKVGREIAEQDQMSSDATDWLREAKGDAAKLGVHGWVTFRDGDAWEVDFVDGAATPHVICAVHAKRPQVFLDCPSQPPELSPEALLLWRARKQAAASLDRTCKHGMNPVVISASMINKPGWLVYFLNPVTKRHMVELGGHIRTWVSEDATQTLDVFHLSKGCLEEEVGEKTAAVATTVVVTDQPVETHVSESIRAKIPIFVGSDKGTWEVDGDRIWKLDEHEATEVK